jgi:hypothetical protein
MPELHNVHAVCRHADGTLAGIFRIGRATTWKRAQDRWSRFDDPRYNRTHRPTIAGLAVDHFNVRSANDRDIRWLRAIPIRQRDVRMETI